jgi:AAA+ ATPase superfamily predicted ATPase
LTICGQNIEKNLEKLNSVPHSPINIVYGPKNSKKSNLFVYFMYHILNFYIIVFSILL